MENVTKRQKERSSAKRERRNVMNEGMEVVTTLDWKSILKR